MQMHQVPSLIYKYRHIFSTWLLHTWLPVFNIRLHKVRLKYDAINELSGGSLSSRKLKKHFQISSSCERTLYIGWISLVNISQAKFGKTKRFSGFSFSWGSCVTKRTSSNAISGFVKLQKN